VPPREVLRLSVADAELEVEETVFLLRDAEGQPLRFACAMRDLSELARWRRATQLLTGNQAHLGGFEEPTEVSVAAEALALADTAAETDAPVLLLGETGVGKSVLARRIHARSGRAQRPFLEINCRTLGSSQTLESELFGHERGAFPGATSRRRGLIEIAHQGTVFFDELAELPLAAQAQLVTLIDARQFRRLGGTRVIQADVRFVGATSADLAKAVEAGAFRKDLFFRINVLPITLAPLRQRRDEIPELARGVLARLGSAMGRDAQLPPDVASALCRYGWPGNLRELNNVLERALILSKGGPLRASYLPAEIVASPEPETETEPDASLRLHDLERQHILKVLESVGGNRTRAARELGISLSTLKRRLAER
jgi:transcriptional regulator with PAS, ATPase and Fis domain